MKKLFLILICLLGFLGRAQQRSLEIKDLKTQKVVVFAENERVKIRTLDHNKHVGNLTFPDAKSFAINGKTIPLDSLQSIKHQPKVLGTVKTVVLAVGLATVATSIILATAGNNAAFLVFAGGSTATIGAGIIEAVNSNYTTRRWGFKIVEK